MFLKLCSQLDAQDVSLQRKSDGLLLLNLPGGEEPKVRSAEQDIIDDAFAFLEAQGLEVDDAKGNPHAPGLAASLTEWNKALAPTEPSFSPEGGSYAEAQKVSITAEENAQIRYTTDGSAPTQDSPLYTGPIPVAVSYTHLAWKRGRQIPLPRECCEPHTSSHRSSPFSPGHSREKA